MTATSTAHADSRTTQEATDLLLAYSRELDLHEPMSLQALVDSHRRLRALNAQRSEDWRAEVQAARQRAAADAREQVQTVEYIALERLRTMTLQQIAELMAGDESAGH